MNPSCNLCASIHQHRLEPPATAGRGRSTVVVLDSGAVSGPLLVQTRRAAGKEDNDGANQQANGCGEDGPDGNAVSGVRARGVVAAVVDVVLEGAKEDKVDNHGHNGHQEREHGNDGCEEGADDASA